MATNPGRHRLRAWWPVLATISLIFALSVSYPVEAFQRNLGPPSAKSGLASWYGWEACRWNPAPNCPTASGQSLYRLLAEDFPYVAMWSVPFGTRVRICSTKQTEVCVEGIVVDRGPAKRLEGRLVDLSPFLFRQLAPLERGILPVTVEILP